MRRRSKEILLLLSKKELEALDKNRLKLGLTRSDYLMKLVNELPPEKCPEPELNGIARKLHEVGIKINNLAHEFNASGILDANRYTDYTNELQEYLREYEAMVMEEIRKINEEENSR